MKDMEIIETLHSKLAMPGGRHLYGILGSYAQLIKFSQKLKDARTPEGDLFPEPISLNQGILKSIPDDEFRHLVENEAKRPEPTIKHVARAFESFLRVIMTLIPSLSDSSLSSLISVMTLFFTRSAISSKRVDLLTI